MRKGSFGNEFSNQTLVSVIINFNTFFKSKLHGYFPQNTGKHDHGDALWSETSKAINEKCGKIYAGVHAETIDGYILG